MWVKAELSFKVRTVSECGCDLPDTQGMLSSSGHSLASAVNYKLKKIGEFKKKEISSSKEKEFMIERIIYLFSKLEHLLFCLFCIQRDEMLQGRRNL